MDTRLDTAVDTAGDAATRQQAFGGSATTEQTRDELVEQDLLVEDVSIDGMCGVY